MRFDYYDLRGKTLQQLGNNEAAIIEMETATQLPSPSVAALAELHTNLALSHRRMGDAKPAERNYRKAIELNPAQFLAHYGLANLLVAQQRNALAETHYRKAVGIKADFSDAYVNLGNVLEFKNRIAEAIQCYETALSIEKDASDIQQMIEAAKEKLDSSAPDAPDTKSTTDTP